MHVVTAQFSTKCWTPAKILTAGSMRDLEALSPLPQNICDNQSYTVDSRYLEVEGTL